MCDGDNGITDFERLMARVNDASAYAYAFDLLALDGDDMRRQPLERTQGRTGQAAAQGKARHPLQRAP